MPLKPNADAVRPAIFKNLRLFIWVPFSLQRLFFEVAYCVVDGLALVVLVEEEREVVGAEP